MAKAQVSARIQGDLYQGLFFWREASKLLKIPSDVSEVIFEMDEAAGVDDLVVIYGNQLQTSHGRVGADYYQIKFHVDKSGQYDSDNFISPEFIKREKSLLGQMYKAFVELKTRGVNFRLHFASNWDWSRDDKFSSLIREMDGEISEAFFKAGPKSDIGKIRKKWMNHLQISETEFEEFARCLRFRVNYLNRADFLVYIDSLLETAGLKPMPRDKLNNPYDGLYLQLVANQQNKFTKDTFEKFCSDQGLFKDKNVQSKLPVGIRSFERFAEYMGDYTASFLCLQSHFEGRHLKEGHTWMDVANDVVYFFKHEKTREALAEKKLIHLDCHASVAFLAGYEADSKSGLSVYPIQKGGHDKSWIPSGNKEPSWSLVNRVIASEQGVDHVISISITRNTEEDVRNFLDTEKIQFSTWTDFCLPEGYGQHVKSADHAKWISDEIVQNIRSVKRTNPSARFHIFAAAPNGLMFFIGQNREALGKISLYEFDFSDEKDSSYSNSINLPIQAGNL